MKRIYAVIELQELSTLDPTNDEDLDALAEDLLSITHGVAGVTVYSSFDELRSDEEAR